MALFKAQLTWSQFKRGEIVEIDDENRGPFERAITRGWLQPYTEDDVIPPLHERGLLTEAQMKTAMGLPVERPDPTRVIDENVEPPDPGPQE
jgi:hypothetical protein